MPDGDQHPAGSGFVCFDATALITFLDNGYLPTLAEWFADGACAPAAVLDLELKKNPHAERKNRDILNATWLHMVTVDDPVDVKNVADLLLRWESKPGKDKGEAEVVTLCKRFGWTALLEDKTGRRAAEDYKLSYVYWVSLIIGACSAGLISEKDAWAMHQVLANADGGGGLSGNDVHKRPFLESIKVVSKVAARLGDPEWPCILGDAPIDRIVRKARDLY
jgi:predicted nucleic acid-binding protein